MSDHNLTAGDWDPKMKEHVGSGDRRASTAGPLLPTLLRWPVRWALLLLLCVSLWGVFTIGREPGPIPGGLKKQQAVAPRRPIKSTDDGVLTGISETMREFNVRGKPKPKPTK